MKHSKRLRDNLTRVEKHAIWALWGDTDLTGLSADKGNVTVILNTEDYTQKIETLLEDPTYKKLAKDPCRGH